MRVYIALPAYNEEESLPQLLPKLKEVLESHQYNYEVVLCDDGSCDATLDLVQEYSKVMPIQLVSHKINRGLGETMRDLYEYIAEVSSEDDVVIRMDCDDTHEPKYIPKLMKKIEEGYDVVIASRFQKGGGQYGVNFYRGFISRCANLFMKFFFPIKGVKEYSCGYRAYKVSLIKKAIKFYGNAFIQLKGLGFTATLEKLLKLNILGAKFGEIGFELRYDQKKSESKMVSSITTLGYFVMVVCYHWPFGGWKRNYGTKLRNN